MAKPTQIESIDQLKSFVHRWQRQLLLRQGVMSLSLALVVAFVLLLWLPMGQSLLWAAPVWLLCWLLLYLRRPLKSINLKRTVSWLDQQHPQLQHSTGLLLHSPDSLSLPARLQQKRIEKNLREVLRDQKPPIALATPLAVLAMVFLVGTLVVRVWQPEVAVPDAFNASTPLLATDSARVQAAAIKRSLPELEEARIRLAPPAYTRQAARFYELSDLQAPQGSRITWQLRLGGGVNKVFLTNQKNDTLLFRQTSKGNWVAQLTAEGPSFYRIGYATPTDTLFSPFLKISVQPDEPPRLRIVKPDQYLLAQQGEAFAVAIEASDDWGLEDLYLSLTISRGSGETVSFQEEKMWIEIPKGAREASKQLQISPTSLGMQPGDELYYRLEAHDNKPPRGQHRRSSSWFYQWQDTAATVSMLSSGLALDVEPEYFRSQRQIIIDTEKLIASQSATPVAKWERANQDLAVDQKLLRLRYGKFLGEEFESTAGGVISREGEDEGEEEEGHEEHEEHEGEGEYGNPRHEHDLPGHEEPAGAAPATGLMELFGHAHDTEEGATFYEERIKVKLKAALAQMWEAEKYLRLSQPKQALPYEYQALKIIKEVQQASRIYVERVGLELPVLIPQEHRLKGEMEAIRPDNRRQQVTTSDTLRASRLLLNRLSYWEVGEQLKGAEQQLLRQTSREVARLMIAGGPYMQYFYLLNSLNELLESPVPDPAEVQKVQAGLFQLLPKSPQPAAGNPALNRLQKQFLQTHSSPQRD